MSGCKANQTDFAAPLQIDAGTAYLRQCEGAILIDVREDDERAGGSARGAHAVPLAQLVDVITAIAPDRDACVMLLCASGQRSDQACVSLRGLGYQRVHSVQGGFRAWCADDLPVSSGALDRDAAERYARHLTLAEVGLAGQLRLQNARVVLMGAGGLGSPVALYLAAAGVGQLTLIDDDHVERSNLQRQVIHTDARIGMAKVESARLALLALNPSITVVIEPVRLRADNVERLLRGHDVVVDGADNFPTRYLLDAACRQLGIPMVYGAALRFTGQVSVFDPRRDDSPCYRCLYPEPPAAVDAPNCSEAGVLGVLPGTIGMLQATEAIKLILQQGRPLVGRVLCYDALDAGFRELRLRRDPHCPGCGPDAVFEGYSDIAQFCASAG